MKVSSSMYGLPGKCIACRRKIRLPRLDELEDGINEIHIKDHPHLLRKVKEKRNLQQETEEAQKALDAVTPSRSKQASSSNEPTPITELDIGGASEVTQEDVAGSLPLNELDALRRLTSIQLILQRKLRDLKKEHPADKALVRETENELIRLKKMRDDFNEQMRQRLMEVAIELANTHDKISKTQITARLGEQPFEVFQETMHRLRSRRDRLERRQINIRGWLAATTPYTAGGLMDATIDDIPEGGLQFSVPSSGQEDGSLLDSHGQALKHAFENRSRAEKEAIEIKKLRQDADKDDRRSLMDAYETNRATRKIARAQVVFYQQRLEHLAKDFQSDCDTLDACMEAARDRMGARQISRAEYDLMEKNARRTKADLMKGATLAKRYAHANAFEDVPAAKATFIDRLAPSSQRNAALQNTNILLRAGAALWLFSIFLPIAGSMSLVGALSNFSDANSVAGVLTVLPVLAAVVTLGFSFVSNSRLRGYALLPVWAITAVVLAFLINESNFSLDLLANRFRSGGLWFVRPGMVTLLAANLLVLIGAVQSLRDDRGARRIIGTSAGLTIALLLWIGSNGFGRYIPEPIMELETESYSEVTERQRGTVRIGNAGHRTLHLVSRRTDARNGYLYGFERRSGAKSAQGITSEGEALGTNSGYATIDVAPRGITEIDFNLPVGNYRFALLPQDPAGTIERDFSILAPMPDVNVQDEGSLVVQVDTVDPNPIPVNTPVEQVMEEPSEPSEPAASDPVPDYPSVKLAGVITGPQGDPEFSIVLTLDAQSEASSTRMKLKEIIYDDWMISEYSSAQNAITLQKGDTFLVVQRGSTEVLREQKRN